jgi:hypothetical protein
MYNSPHHPDFVQHITQLHDMCRARQCSWGIEYDEGQDLWQVCIYSSAPREHHIGRDHTLGLALEAAIEHLAGIAVCK